MFNEYIKQKKKVEKKKIIIGSVVKLNGQDIKMTVENIITPSIEQTLYDLSNIIQTKAKCVWFVDQKLYKDTFSIKSLTLIEK